MMVGLPASGKTTIAQELSYAYGAKIHSLDDIRENIFGDRKNQTNNVMAFDLLCKHMRNDLINRQSVILDCTNIKLKDRRFVLNLLSNIKCYKIAYIMSKSIEQCLVDNKLRIHQVPDYVIKDMSKKFSIPFYEEGFDCIKIHGVDDVFFTGEKVILDRMLNFNQSKLHQHDLLTHCKLTQKMIKNESKDKALSIGALYHDYGKIFTKKIDSCDEAHYPHHANIGAYELLQNLNSLNVDYMPDILNALFYINYHMLPFDWTNSKTKIKYLHVFGKEKFNNLVLLNSCDRLAAQLIL